MVHLNWKPDKNAPETVLSQIVSYLLSRITSGEWPVGATLPPQRTLARDFGVHRSTVVSAMDVLKSEGIIESSGRGGTRVAHSTVSASARTQADWQGFIDDSFHMANNRTITMINEAEPDDSMLRLSSGEASPTILPSHLMKQVLVEVANTVQPMGYELPRGLLPLRRQISKYLQKSGIHADPDSILIVSGALQAIQLISIGLLQTGSTVFVENPSYLYSLQILQTLGMKRAGITMDEQGITTDRIAEHIRRKRQSILYTIPNYQNPTGIVMSMERRRELLNTAVQHRIPIVEDDVYGELWIDEPPPPPIKSLDQDGNTLYIGSVSKTLSPGLRIGWIVGPEAVIQRLSDIKMQMDYGSSSLSQQAVAKWFETGLYDTHLETLRRELKTRRDITNDALCRYFGDMAQWSVPKGGYYFWVRMNIPLNMIRFFQEAYARKILIYPGYLYGPENAGHFRISYSYAQPEAIRSGIKALADIARGILAAGQ